MARRVRPRKLRVTLPARYRRGFVWTMDMRAPAAMTLCAEIVNWTQHLGGPEQLGHDDELRIERAAFLTLKLREHESAVLRGEPGLYEPNEYSAAINALHGLLNRLGPRRAKPVASLHDYLAKRTSTPSLVPPVRRAAAPPVDIPAEPVASHRASEEAAN